MILLVRVRGEVWSSGIMETPEGEDGACHVREACCGVLVGGRALCAESRWPRGFYGFMGLSAPPHKACFRVWASG